MKHNFPLGTNGSLYVKCMPYECMYQLCWWISAIKVDVSCVISGRVLWNISASQISNSCMVQYNLLIVHKRVSEIMLATDIRLASCCGNKRHARQTFGGVVNAIAKWNYCYKTTYFNNTATISTTHEMFYTHHIFCIWTNRHFFYTETIVKLYLENCGRIVRGRKGFVYKLLILPPKH